MVDDQPEVSNVDPAFLYDSNDGFQEVTSSKTKKVRQRMEALVAAQALKKAESLKEKREKRDAQQSKVCMGGGEVLEVEEVGGGGQHTGDIL